MEEADRFKQQMKGNCGDLVKKLKPKQFYYAYPSLINTNEYYRNGWHNSETLKTDFEISDQIDCFHGDVQQLFFQTTCLSK